MPQKSIQQRVKQSKQRGDAPALKTSDMGRSEGSAHAAKKSRQVAAFAQLTTRTVSKKAAPGEGAQRGRKSIPDVRAAYRAENAASGGGRPQRIRHEEHVKPVAKVNGRKKPPSRMNIKGRGGP